MMNFSHTVKLFVLVILSGFTLLNISACSEEAPTKISYKDRKYADSLYKDTAMYYKGVLDSICELNHDVMVSKFRDSIMKERVAEMEAQKAKIKRELQNR